MMKKTVRTIALLLCISLVAALIPISLGVFAAGQTVPINGDFENATEGQLPANWTITSTNSGGYPANDNWAGNYVVSTVTERESKALKLEPKNATRGYICVLSDAFPADAKTAYTVAYDRKIQNPNDVAGSNSGNYGAKVMTYYYDQGMNYLGADWKDGKKAQQDWTKHSFEVTSLSNTAYIRVGFYIGGSWDAAANFAYLYDNVSVRKTDEIGNEPDDTEPPTTEPPATEPPATEPPATEPTPSELDATVPVIDFNGDAEQTNDGTLPMWSVTQMNSNSTIATNSNWPFTATAGIGQGVDGSNSLRFQKNKGYGYAALTSIAIDVAPEAYYRLDYMLKFSNVSGAGRMLGLRVIAEELDAKGNQVNWYKIDDTGAGIGDDKDLSNGYSSPYTEWTAVATGFKTGLNTKKVRLYFWLGGINGSNQATADLDNIILTQLSEKELINGDMDMVNLGHVKDGRKGEVAGQVFWSPETTYPWGYTSRTDANFTSNYAMLLADGGEGHQTAAKICVTRSSGGLGASTYYSEPMQVKPGESYTTTYDLKIAGVDDASVTGGAVYMVRFLDATKNIISLGTDANGNKIQAKELNGHPKQNQDWTAYSHTFTVPDNAYYIQIGMTIGVGVMDTNAGMEYWYDNITLNSVRAAEDIWSDLYGKTVIWVGDETAQTLAQQSEGISAMKPVVNAVAGAGFAKTVSDRIVSQLSGKGDYLLIAAYPADAKQSVPAGTVTAEGTLTGFDTATYAGALEEMFLAVAGQYDGCKVAYIFPAIADSTDISTYYSIAKEACAKWRIPFIDLYGQTFESDEAMYQTIKPELTKLEAYNALNIPGFSIETVLYSRLTQLVGAAVTPATDADALAALLVDAEKNGLTELVEKIEAYLEQYQAFRPQMLGATIGDREPNGLRFIGQNANVQNVTISRSGILVIAEQLLRDELSLYTQDAIAYETENPAPCSLITGTAVGGSIIPSVEYAAVAYTVYLVDGEEYAFYSVNDYKNENGKVTAENGMSICSVYGIAKDIAAAIVASEHSAIDYSAIGGQANISLIAGAEDEGTEVTCYDVFAFVCDNWQLLFPQE